MSFDAFKLAGKYFIVTGSGKFFKNVKEDPAANLGIIRITADGMKFFGALKMAVSQQVNFLHTY